MSTAILVATGLLLCCNSLARAAGPLWTVRDIDQFQDNFSADGTTSGPVRADMANDILPDTSPGILPGDSAVVVVSDPVFGLATDGVLGGKAVYCYVLVNPNQHPPNAKTGAMLSGGSRWPYAGTETINGWDWTKLRLDQSDVGGGPVPDNFCIDLNDNLFTPGDMVYFFYAAKSNDGPGTMTYFSLEIGTTSDIAAAAAMAMEFTCLPLIVDGSERFELYVDGAEGTDSQVYVELAFGGGYWQYGNRYDVRGPLDGANNSLASRVVDVQQQLNGAYQLIYWESDNLPTTLSDGSGKTDDYALLNEFLGNLPDRGGVFLFGDDMAQNLDASTSPSALAFKSTYMPFTLVSGDQRPQFGLGPVAVPWPGRAFVDGFRVYGAAPPENDFDVLQATGSSRLEMTYGPNGATNGAVISNQNGDATVMMAGFGLKYVRDDDLDEVIDRGVFLHRAAYYTAYEHYHVPESGAGPALDVSLQQNYPNPFNPQTTIGFSISERAGVSLRIYSVAGERVCTLLNEIRPAGAHAVVWDGRNDAGEPVTSGVYFYRLVAGGLSQTKKMVLLK